VIDTFKHERYCVSFIFSKHDDYLRISSFGYTMMLKLYVARVPVIVRDLHLGTPPHVEQPTPPNPPWHKPLQRNSYSTALDERLVD
jgi:hypothetical protein